MLGVEHSGPISSRPKDFGAARELSTVKHYLSLRTSGTSRYYAHYLPSACYLIRAFHSSIQTFYNAKTEVRKPISLMDRTA